MKVITLLLLNYNFNQLIKSKIMSERYHHFGLNSVSKSTICWINQNLDKFPHFEEVNLSLKQNKIRFHEPFNQKSYKEFLLDMIERYPDEMSYFHYHGNIEKCQYKNHVINHIAFMFEKEQILGRYLRHDINPYN